MPLDASLPSDHLAFKLEHSSAYLVVSTEDCRDQIEALDLAIPVINIRSKDLAMRPKSLQVKSPATRTDEAYVEFVHGYSARPHMFSVCHEDAIACCQSNSGDLDFPEGKRVTLFCSIGCETFQAEIWATMSCGVALILQSENCNIGALDCILACNPTSPTQVGIPAQSKTIMHLPSYKKLSRARNCLHKAPVEYVSSGIVDYIEGQDDKKTQSYWESVLDGVPPSIVAQGGNKLIAESEGSSSLQFTLPLYDVSLAAKRAGVTLATLTKFAWGATLRKFLRQDDIVMGQVVSNRSLPVKEIERMLGATLNTIPCRITINDAKSVISLLRTVQSDHTSSLQHSHASLVDMKKWSGMNGELFDTLFVFQHSTVSDSEEAHFTPVDELRSATYYACEVEVSVLGNTMLVNAFRDISQLSSSQVGLTLVEFEFTLGQVRDAVFSDGPASLLWEMSPGQCQMFQEFCFGPDIPLPYELLQQAFEDRATTKPHLIAVEFEGQRISYGELNEQATTLAHHLVSLGVGVGSRVAVVMERCLEFPIGLLAVLKAGGSMMPLDATFPSNRLSFMLGDANACVVVSTKDYRDQVEALDLSVPVVYIDSTNLATTPNASGVLCPATRKDEAYVVYTSGSTGRPKGVPVLHVGAVNLTLFPLQKGAFIEGTRVMQFLAIGFDWCLEEIWKTLNNGATLVLRSKSVFETLPIVDVISCTPTALSSFGHPSQYPNIRHFEIGGEAIPTSLKDLWSPYVNLTNGYGLTECSSVTHGIQLKYEEPVTIGPTRPNVHCYVLDDNLRQVPVGVVGEIYLGGMCVSPGYINLPDQTTARFVEDPFVCGGGRMFRTGDYGRLLPNGRFEIHGRKDSQVKLKGYRIELEEIGEAMMHHPQVTAAAAVVKDKTHLVGYFTPASVDVEELRTLVTSHLPVYMVPAVWVPLESIPQNVNGKTDRLALERMDVVVHADALVTDVEVKMAEVWASVLDVDLSAIGGNTSFYALGGDSLSVVKVVAACRKVGLAISVAQLLKNPVLSRAAGVCGTEAAIDWPPVVLPEAIANEVADIWTKPLDLREYVVYAVTPLQATPE
ncbi:hypothetical protein AeMF1_010340 [Aphanomyces euteiches]|nr:hypothetical protein AeMF1_010340 [Aphanomyces euteiches]KAH9191719.1 hypothetical protein AeNC1_006314 [Aphanomyces euteiches]